jgi:L-ascorbate metabolism protein UlaG (beta-lactamase superfamily)
MSRKRKMFWFFTLTLITAFLIALQMASFIVPAVGKSPNKKQMAASPYYRKGKFVNSVPTKSADFSQVPRIFRNYWKRNVENEPLKSYQFTETGFNDTTQQLQVNWLGHAAVLLHKNGRYVLTDPMLSERASPFQFMGPKRFCPSPIAAADLPHLAAVVISHDHYDHLDYGTILAIKDKTDYFYVPTGVAASLRFWGVEDKKIRELSWWESATQEGELRFTATPARHFSGRMFSQNNTFWASWVIEWGDQKVFFGGDTGIFDGFAEIDQQFGPFDVALLPIGAYNEAWHDIHTDAKEAVLAFEQMRASHLFAIHWGTFDLALHSWYEPMYELEQLASERQLPLLSFPIGEWFTTQKSSQTAWWKAYSAEF